MAVILPSDLIADVMRAADPSRIRTASAKLGDGELSRTAFRGAMDEVAGSSKIRDRNDDLIADVLAAADGTSAAAAETRLAELVLHDKTGEASNERTYKAFEQMFLRNMFEQMMPPAESGIYGADSSGSIWRSLANDQLASVYSERGGLGIARTLSGGQELTGVQADRQWPYFETNAIRGFAG